MRRRFRTQEIESARKRVESHAGEQVAILERRMVLLATCVTAAPLLGLLGTVWGLMEAFGTMASGGSAMLSAVAPGISGALLTTVVGLVVAIPSAVMYNILTDRVRALCVEMDGFLQTLFSDIERHYQKEA